MKNYAFNSATGFRAALLAAGSLLLAACAPGQDTPSPSASIDVSRYLAVGDTYTAGVSAGGLTRASQGYSFPNLLAQQLSRANAGATFSQPLLEDGSGSGYLSLIDLPASGIPRVRRVAGQAVLRTVVNPTACGGPDTVRLLTRSATASTLPQNLGVPGLQVGQVEVAGLGNAANATPGGAFNPYFERLLPAADSRTYLQTVTTASTGATFFTFFMGLDNLLPYVRSGGTCGPLPVTSLTTLMKNNAKKLLDQLAANGRPGIIARLPDLNKLPLLRTGRGQQLQTRLQASFGDTARLYIENPFGTGASQPIADQDYVLANALPRVGVRTAVVVNGTTMQLPYGRDSRNPLRNADVLDGDEYNRINGILTSYNNELERLATDVYKLPVLNPATTKHTLDTNASFPSNVGESFSISGVEYSSELVRGNFFSLDYYTLTPRGNALLANAFIGAINRGYKANIPSIDANALPTTAQ